MLTFEYFWMTNLLQVLLIQWFRKKLFFELIDVCLFVCLFNSYIVPLSRESMRGVIYSDFSCHLYTIRKQENDDRLNFKSPKAIFFLINLCLKSRKRLFHSKLSFVIVSHSSCCLVSDLHSLCRVRIIEWPVQTSKRSSLLSNDLKTIKSFQIELFEFYLTFWSFYSVLNPCTRKRHSTVIEDIIRNVVMIDDDDQRMMWHVLFSLSKRQCSHSFRLHNSLCLRRTLICLSWSSFLVCLAEVIVRSASEDCLLWKNSCTLENALSFTINRSSSVSLSKDRRCRRRLFELRWDVWTVTARS
jgi:hypothetical protein